MIDPVIPHIPKPARKVLTSTALKLAEYEAPNYFVVVDNDTTIEDIMRPAFWAHHSGKLRKNNTIDIVRENSSLDMQVRVIESGQGFVRVRPLRAWEDEEVAKARAADVAAEETNTGAVKLPEEYKITSGRGSFVLTYVPTDTRIGQGYKTRGLAEEAARAHAASAGIEWPDQSEAA